MTKAKVLPIDDLDLLKSSFTETEEVILKRRSVRLFKKRQVPEFMIRRILEAGRFAPSAGNCQPWKFIVIRDPEIIQGITDTTVKTANLLKKLVDYRQPGKGWKKPFAKMMTLLKPNDMHPTPFGAVSLLAEERLSLYHDAPTVILMLKDVRGIGSPDLDCGIAGQNIVLAAHSMGLGTCWISFAKLAFQYSNKWNKFFNISYPYKFLTSFSIGWPINEPDGMVERQTHAVDWYEDGNSKVIY